MNVSGLLKRFDEVDSLRELAEKAEPDLVQTVGAMVEGARPAVVAFLASKLSTPTVVVTGHPHRAEYLVGELAAWLPPAIPVALLPPFESWPHERAPGDRDTLARRQSVVNRLLRENLVVVASVRALLQPVGLPTPGTAPVELRKGSAVQIEELLASLVGSGYEATALVEEAGSFSRRGGIVDVFPIGGPHPVRVELLGSEIESLRVFDPVSQRSTRSRARTRQR